MINSLVKKCTVTVLCIGGVTMETDASVFTSGVYYINAYKKDIFLAFIMIYFKVTVTTNCLFCLFFFFPERNTIDANVERRC